MKCWWKSEASRILLHCWWKKNFITTLEINMIVLIKLNIQTLYDLAIPLLGIYLWEMKTCVHKKICTRMFTVPLFIMFPNGNNSHVHNRKDYEQIVAF